MNGLASIEPNVKLGLYLTSVAIGLIAAFIAIVHACISISNRQRISTVFGCVSTLLGISFLFKIPYIQEVWARRAFVSYFVVWVITGCFQFGAALV